MAASSPLRILLVEDNYFNQRVAVGMLSKPGHAVVIANNGREGVEVFAREPFDLVLMDMHMPEMDGFRATELIRAQQEKSGNWVPIVAVTAHAMAGYREKCLAAGMDDYLSKPIDREELFRVIQNVTSGVRQQETSIALEIAPAKPAQPSNIPSLKIDAEALLNRCGGDHELLSTLIEMFPEESNRLMSALDQARVSGDVAAVQLNAHTIKGMCKMFGAAEAATAALAVENAAREGGIGTDQQAAFLRAELLRAVNAVAHMPSVSNLPA